MRAWIQSWPSHHPVQPINKRLDNLWDNLTERIELLRYPTWTMYEFENIRAHRSAQRKCLILCWEIMKSYQNKGSTSLRPFDPPKESFLIKLRPDGTVLWKWYPRPRASVSYSEALSELPEEAIKYLRKINDVLIVQDIIE